MAPSKVTLKLLIDRRGKRVLFAEAGKEFVDFLFSLLTLPIGTVMRLLADNEDMQMTGFAKIYESVSDLKEEYILYDKEKDILLEPNSELPFYSPKVPLLPIEDWSSSPVPPKTRQRTYYKCNVCPCGALSPQRGYQCLFCSQYMDTKAGDYVLKSDVEADEGFVKRSVTYMVTDDLGVSPISAISTITLQKRFNINRLGALEEKVIKMGTDEGLKLLKHSWNSNTVLTDVFLGELEY